MMIFRASGCEGSCAASWEGSGLEFSVEEGDFDAGHPMPSRKPQL